MWEKLVRCSSSKSGLLSNLLPSGEKLPMAGKASNPARQMSVNEEYSKTLRTKSFLDMCAKVNRRAIGAGPRGAACNAPAVSCTQPSDFLVEPSQETLANFHIHSGLLLEYFDITLQAFTAYTKLLASVCGARAHHLSISSFLVRFSPSSSPDERDHSAEFDRLAALVGLDNPLCPRNLALFHSVQSKYGALVRKLTGSHRRALRRATVRWLRRLERVGAAAQVDAAARGAYIVGRDLETVSRMVRRVHDEVEHEREVVRMVVRERDRQLAREAAREVEGGAAGVEEQMEELEEHVCLCLTTINRSRKMVAGQIMAGDSSTVLQYQ